MLVAVVVAALLSVHAPNAATEEMRIGVYGETLF